MRGTVVCSLQVCKAFCSRTKKSLTNFCCLRLAFLFASILCFFRVNRREQHVYEAVCVCVCVCVCACVVQGGITFNSSCVRTKLRVPKMWQELLYVTNLTFSSTTCVPTTALCLDNSFMQKYGKPVGYFVLFRSSLGRYSTKTTIMDSYITRVQY